MDKQIDEIDALIGAFSVIACGEAIPDSASPDNDLSFSQQLSDNAGKKQTAGSTTNLRPHGPKPTYGPGAFSPIPDEEVIALFRLKAQYFLELHAQHIAPPDPTEPISRRLGGCCGHLKDQLRRVLLRHSPRISAHVNSNAPYERLCIACIRMRRNIERYQCTLCGGRNPTRGRFKTFSRSAVEITQVPLPPLTWHVPMCRRCRHVIEVAFRYTGLVPPTPTEDAEVTA